MKKLFENRDIDRTISTIPVSDSKPIVVLAANVAFAITVPVNAKFVSFERTTDFFAKFGLTGQAAAVVPLATDLTNALDLNPLSRILSNETQISIVSPVVCTVQAVFYG